MLCTNETLEASDPVEISLSCNVWEALGLPCQTCSSYN